MKNLSFLKVWHRAFALHIEYIIEGIEEIALSPSVVGDATDCRFGKWAISSPQELRDDPKFKALLAVHAQFHQIAALSMRMHVDGNHLAARTLSRDLMASSESFVVAVDELEESLNSTRASFDPNALRLKPQVAASSWDDSLLIGISALDEQHKGIAKLADEFFAAPTDRLSSERGGQLLYNTQALLALHFETEELYMSRTKMPEDEIEAHKADHDEILNSVVSIAYELAVFNVDKSFGDMYSLLQKLLIDHVVSFDVNLPKTNLRFGT